MKIASRLLSTLAFSTGTLVASAMPSIGTDSTSTQVTPPSAAHKSFQKIRIGGYGESVAQFKDYGTNRFYGSKEGNPKKTRNTIAIPRFVLSLDYKFTEKWVLGSEIEFESGGTGIAYELENTENGEYETEIEKAGEVALEQFHITRVIIPAFNVRVGHMVLPIGLTNAHHEPINFFSTTRPEGERSILPSTWHETGLSIYGSLGRGAAAFRYQAMIVAGLNANGFNRNNWVAGGKQSFFEADNFTSPAYVLRLEYLGIPGLRLGGSMYHCTNTGANSDKADTYAGIGSIPLTILTADAQYRNRFITARANIVYGTLGKADQVAQVNRGQSSKSPYSRIAPIAAHALSYHAEVGVNLHTCFPQMTKMPILYPFAQYEYYNPQQQGSGMHTMDKRNQVSKWTAGLNWFALPNLVVKADYTTRQIGTNKPWRRGTYNSENEFSIGVAFVGWFFTH